MPVNKMLHFERRTRALAVLMITLLAFPLPAQENADKPAEESIGPPPEAGSLEGRVLDRDGKNPVSGAVVYAFHLDTGQVFASSATDGKGRYSIAGLPLGWFDLFVRTEEGVFVANHVVIVSPDSRTRVSMSLAAYSDEAPSWWTGDRRQTVPGLDEEASGVASLDRATKGRSFWGSPIGIAIVAGGGVLVVLGIVLAGSDERVASPSLP